MGKGKLMGNAKVITNKEEMMDILDSLGLSQINKKIEKSRSEWMYIEKMITFADIPTRYKYCAQSSHKNARDAYSEEKLKERADKNLLFYKTPNEMSAFEKKNKSKRIFFNQTRQSSIYLPDDFYIFVGEGAGARDKNGYLLNNSNRHCYLINSTMHDFQNAETNRTLSNLNKNQKKTELKLNPGDYTEISVNVSVHGLGKKTDEIFNLVRSNVFATDKIIVIVEKKKSETNIFFGFFRNPQYYRINKLPMPGYLIEFFERANKEKEPEESRKGQAKWRETLAESVIAMEDGAVDYVTCPFTGLHVKYPSEATLLRASHIKAYAKCVKDKKIDISEAYDIDNGFLVTANVDALFDKYLITVDYENGNIIWSKTISQELKNNIGIKRQIEKKYYVSKKKYIKDHYLEFTKREEKRSAE